MILDINAVYTDLDCNVATFHGLVKSHSTYTTSSRSGDTFSHIRTLSRNTIQCMSVLDSLQVNLLVMDDKQNVCEQTFDNVLNFGLVNVSIETFDLATYEELACTIAHMTCYINDKRYHVTGLHRDVRNFAAALCQDMLVNNF